RQGDGGLRMNARLERVVRCLQVAVLAANLIGAATAFHRAMDTKREPTSAEIAALVPKTFPCICELYWDCPVGSRADGDVRDPYPLYLLEGVHSHRMHQDIHRFMFAWAKAHPKAKIKIVSALDLRKISSIDGTHYQVLIVDGDSCLNTELLASGMAAF